MGERRTTDVLPALFLGAIVAAVLALAACGETDADSRSAPSGPPDLALSLAAAEWLLDVDDSSIAGAGTPVTLVVDGSTASGTAACNTYRGGVTLDGDDGVRFGGIATTMMACPPAVMAAERDYLDALARVRTADTTDRDRLVLTADGVRLSFTAIDARELLAGEWAITGIRSADAIRSAVEGTEPVARFGADGDLVVETGCNTLRAGWSVDGTAISLTPAAGTLQTCPEPPGVMEQEVAIAAALEDAATVQVTPVALTLLDEAGLIVLDARRP